MSQARLSHFRVAPEAMNAMLGVSTTLAASMLEKPLRHLVDIRVSQINGCAFCLDMHAREFLSTDPDLQRLNSVAAWREAGFYSDRERAALQWAESLTLLGSAHPPQDHFDALRPHFSDKEVVELTVAVAQINAWNRVSVGMAVPVARKALAAAA
ncbi:carboxymuconolactone decarboxylase family protein [uncultured Ramlibacter sp.]|uniref:carboxymuconolactone decarboxylase family protein n=1 Tax=uncultured Ramlibacter sp. TaxID=260755 RepID=UPI0026355E4E|nr:carboxymuconolactone decarboxylase family protein [uncultured Ramlibacter sp.]